ncbi:MAG: BON domain-containing protein [Pseudomonadota bacterium]
MNQRILSMTTIGALVASVALAGCTRNEQQDAKNSAGDTVAGVEQKAREVGNDASTGMDKAKDAAANASTRMGDKIDDAVITSSVKTELAKDPNLSALAINVDTDSGRVALKGNAPTPTAKARATTLAQNVKGVISVDNQLTIKQ